MQIIQTNNNNKENNNKLLKARFHLNNRVVKTYKHCLVLNYLDDECFNFKIKERLIFFPKFEVI